MKTAVLIDGSNLHAGANAINMRIDFKLMLDWLDNRYNTPQVQYYTALYADKDNDGHIKLQTMVDWLNYNGYLVITKEAKKLGDKIKGNMDIEIAIDAIELCANGIERIVLFTGDGDFVPLLVYLQRRGVWVTVISAKPAQNSVTADELRKQCNQYIELEVLKDWFTEMQETEM